VILNEHTFGVCAVAFSPDNRYLASIGAPNDGFLYLWSINPRTGAARLHSSNKCTSFIKGMTWMGKSIITVGTRHVKVWRIDEGLSVSPSKQKFGLEGMPAQTLNPATVTRTLAGRNCLLGSLVEATFTCVAAVSDEVAIVCSERGDICLLDDSNDGQKLSKIHSVDFSITCVAVNQQRGLVSVGGRGAFNVYCLDELLDLGSSAEPSDVSTDLLCPMATAVAPCAMALGDDYFVAIDSQNSITVSKYGVALEHPTPLTAHRDPVLGVSLLSRPNEMDADLFTWSSSGEVLFWDLSGGPSKGLMTVAIEQPPSVDDGSPNQCQIVRASKEAAFFVSGDKHGVLRILDGATRECTFTTKAHSSDIQDIAIHEGVDHTLLASCGRDRTVQLYRMAPEWTLVQTMDEHAGACCGVLFCDGGNTLVSASTDRTIHVRQLVSREVNGQVVVAMVPTRIINLRASPVSMVLSSTQQLSYLVVSLLDRTVATYDIGSGKLVSSFRATDSEGSDAVVMDALVMGKATSSASRPTMLAGVSSTDKSVRIYDGLTGAFIDREWGHTSAVTDLALLETADSDTATLISTGADGTIMVWEVTNKAALSPEMFEPVARSRDQSPPKEALAARPPLRRVLSKAELAEFQRPSPSSTPNGRSSPPRSLRRKPSKFGMSSQVQKSSIAPVPLIPPAIPSSTTVDFDIRKGSYIRGRSPPSPRSRVSRRPSLAALDLQGRSKSSTNLSEFGSLNMATEQVCRTLRAYQKKLSTSEVIRDSLLHELDQELGLTAKALRDKTSKTKAMSESVLSGLLDQYSERLVSLFDEKLRLSLGSTVLDGGTTANGSATTRSLQTEPRIQE
jgi:WD40 repeat protein